MDAGFPKWSEQGMCPVCSGLVGRRYFQLLFVAFMSTSWLCLFVFIFCVQGKASGYDTWKRDVSVLLAMIFGLRYALTVSASMLCLLDTLVGFRRVSGKSSINFSIFGGCLLNCWLFFLSSFCQRFIYIEVKSISLFSECSIPSVFVGSYRSIIVRHDSIT